MALINEADIRKITQKYAYSIQNNSNKITNIRQIITNEFKKINPNEFVTNENIQKTIAYLTSKAVINDKTISEAVKQVIDNSANDDLNLTVGNYIKQLRPKNIKANKDDVANIISSASLNPETSTPFHIKNAVVNYYSSKTPDAAPIIKSPNEKIKVSSVPPINPSKLTFFERVRAKEQRYSIQSLTKASRNWLTDNIKKISGSSNRKQLIKEGETMAEAIVGQMFMYFYDPKHKDTLPFYDTFPLVFIVDILPNGTEESWTALNLHYLDIKLRLKLFDKLLQYAENKTLTKDTKLRLSYSLLKGFSTLPEAAPCFKRYLGSFVKSNLVKIDAVDWEIALFLPTEQFVKETKETVWRDSRKKIRGGK